MYLKINENQKIEEDMIEICQKGIDNCPLSIITWIDIDNNDDVKQDKA